MAAKTVVSSSYAEATIDSISAEYRQASVPWIIGFSGGKDSSALLRLVYLAVGRLKRPRVPVCIVYCDTGVEIPVVARFVRRTLRALSAEASMEGLPVEVRVARPPAADSYFVKVIGRGYPPPTNKFRWCTDRLRIAPVQRIVKQLSADGGLILLGLRHGESQERDKTLHQMHERDRFFRQTGAPNTLIYAPILDYSTDQVWETLVEYPLPKALDTHELARLYRDASGECPLIRDPAGSPCGKGRFGCWTCTVVRTDHSLTGLTERGYDDLKPLLDFRDWLQRIRDEPAFRCSQRRNGGSGPGPFTLAARRTILRRLRSAEARSGYRLLSQRELTLIHELWRSDRKSPLYCET